MHSFLIMRKPHHNTGGILAHDRRQHGENKPMTADRIHLPTSAQAYLDGTGDIQAFINYCTEAKSVELGDLQGTLFATGEDEQQQYEQIVKYQPYPGMYTARIGCYGIKAGFYAGCGAGIVSCLLGLATTLTAVDTALD